MGSSVEVRIAGVGLRISEEEGALTQVWFAPEAEDQAAPEGVLRRTVEQLREYFAGRRRAFDLRMNPRGTPFQLAVWNELREIPYGETRSYSDIARAVGRPEAVRAVGAANGANPIGIIVPCHRVIGSDGSLTGFGGGLELKRKLLRLEGALPTDPAERQGSLFPDA